MMFAGVYWVMGKLDNKTGATLKEMSVEERKSYCLHDAHLVAELVRIKNGDIIRIMQVISFHTRLRFEEVCHKGMTGIWKKILNEEISKKIDLVGYSNLPSILRKLYSSKLQLFENSNNYIDDDYEEDWDDTDMIMIRNSQIIKKIHMNNIRKCLNKKKGKED